MKSRKSHRLTPLATTVALLILAGFTAQAGLMGSSALELINDDCPNGAAAFITYPAGTATIDWGRVEDPPEDLPTCGQTFCTGTWYNNDSGYYGMVEVNASGSGGILLTADCKQ